MANFLYHQLKFYAPDMDYKQIHTLLVSKFGDQEDNYCYAIDKDNWVHIDVYNEDMILDAQLWVHEISNEPLHYG